jgi:hypothetical protein
VRWERGKGERREDANRALVHVHVELKALAEEALGCVLCQPFGENLREKRHKVNRRQDCEKRNKEGHAPRISQCASVCRCRKTREFFAGVG